MSSPGQPSLPGITEEQGRWLEIWKKAEDVAVHFNQMLMSFRIQALGGGAVATGLIGTILFSGDGLGPTRSNFRAFAAGMLFLAVIWGAIWIIDLRYYQRLLLGAVGEAERLERQSGGLVRLSRAITQACQTGEKPGEDLEEDVPSEDGRRAAQTTPAKDDSTVARRAFYALPFVAFLLAGVAALMVGVLRDPEAVGCTKDTDCKGERICVAQACADATRPEGSLK